MRAWVVAASLGVVSTLAMAGGEASARPRAGAPRSAGASKGPPANANATPAGREAVPRMRVTETVARPAVDYQAETYCGVPLDGAYARERGLTRGLVLMVFEREQRPAFRIGHERIERVVRLVEDDAATAKASPFVASPLVPASTGTLVGRATTATRIDVLDTKDGVVVVETSTASPGIFTRSEVYVFARGATAAQRSSALESVTTASRERIRTALALALR